MSQTQIYDVFKKPFNWLLVLTDNNDYKYCFDTEQLSNIYNKFLAGQRSGNIENSKEFIQLIFLDFVSELKNVQINNEIKNKDYFFEELLQEIQKSVKLYENIISQYEDKEFIDFVKQVIRMSSWFIDEIIEKYNSIDSVRKFETKLKLNTPSKYPNIFKNKVAEEFFNYAIGNFWNLVKAQVIGGR